MRAAPALIAPILAAALLADALLPAALRAQEPAAPDEQRPRFAWVTDSVAAPLNLPPLRAAKRVEGVREIRIWTGFGIVLQHGLVRLVESPEGVRGERVERDPPVDWERFLEALRRHRILDLPDPSTLEGDGIRGTDGFTLVVEVLDGSRYHTYAYWNPWMQPWPEARHAVAIADLVVGIGAP